MIENHKTLAEKFIKKGFWLYLFSFIIAPIWYIVKIIISSEISVSELWILYWIISLITMLSVYNDLWMTESMKFFIPKFIEEKRFDKVKSIIFYAISTQVFTSVLISLFFYFWADFIAENYFKSEAAKETLKIFAFFFVWLNIFQTLNNFFMAVQNTFYNKITELLRMSFILFSVLFVFFWDLWSLQNYSYSWLIWLSIWIILVFYFFIKNYYKKFFKWEKILFEKKLFLEIFKYASVVLVWAWAWTILWQIDMQMVIYLLWTESAWYYTNYLSIIWIPFILIWPIFGFLFPVFSELNSKWDFKKIKLIKEIFVKNFLLISIMFNIFFFVFAEILAFTLFWEKFLESGKILQYSILFLSFNFLLQINFNILAWIWKAKDRVKILFIAVIFNFFANLFLINKIWVSWAALATWIWWVLIWILWEFFLWKKYFVSFDFKNLFKNILILWIFWFLINKYFLIYLENFSRVENFFALAWFFWVWSLVFILVNFWEVKGFFREIRRIKK